MRRPGNRVNRATSLDGGETGERPDPSPPSLRSIPTLSPAAILKSAQLAKFNKLLAPGARVAKSSLANRNSFGDKGELPWNPRPGTQF